MMKKMDKLRRNFLRGADDERDHGRAPKLRAMRWISGRTQTACDEVDFLEYKKLSVKDAFLNGR